MKILRTLIVFPAIVALLATSSAFAQTERFSDPNVEYMFDIPDSKWKMVSKPSATNQNVEYVYVDRNDGHIEVRKLKVAENAVLSDIIRNEEQKMLFLQGYVAGKEENFGGHLNGTVFNFEYVKASRPMSGRFYFLRANPTTVYVLRFTGYKDKLRSIRNQTDSIARTFEIKKGV